MINPKRLFRLPYLSVTAADLIVGTLKVALHLTRAHTGSLMFMTASEEKWLMSFAGNAWMYLWESYSVNLIRVVGIFHCCHCHRAKRNASVCFVDAAGLIWVSVRGDRWNAMQVMVTMYTGWSGVK